MKTNHSSTKFNHLLSAGLRALHIVITDHRPLAGICLCFATLLAAREARAQTITALGNNYQSSALSYNTDGTNAYFVQFGVSGSNTGSSLLNPKGISFPSLSLSSVTESGNQSGQPSATTQYTSTITLNYTDGASPASSSATVGGSGTAGTVSVRTGYNNNNNQASGQTLNFTITFNQAVNAATFSLFGNTFSASSATTFTLNPGASGQSSFTYSDPVTNDGNTDYVQQFQVNNIPANTVLTIADQQTGLSSQAPDDNPYANVSLSGLVVNSISVVPEPSTWAAVLGGAGLVGLSLRRHRA